MNKRTRTHDCGCGWTVEVYPDPEKRSRSVLRICGPDFTAYVDDDGRPLRVQERRAIEVATALASEFLRR